VPFRRNSWAKNLDAEPSILGARLVQWWLKNRRSYPWRETCDPYKILLAEIMLQRTRAEQVTPVYSEFLEKFPTIFDLAGASEKDIAPFFGRLGLSWRTRTTKKMAEFVIKKYNGLVPQTMEQLLEIPGVGEYISAAVLSFAYEKPAIVVDSNVCRVIMRVYGIRGDGELRKNKKIRDIANKMLPMNEKSKCINLALIDFAALICKPAKPLCPSCPLNFWCEYYHRVSYVKIEK
jgi:A/G-specific adenine glycosylase